MNGQTRIGSDSEKPGFFEKIKAGLQKTRNSLTRGLGELILGRKEIDQDLLDEIETRLLIADVGVETTRKVIDSLTDQVSRKTLKDASALMEALKAELRARLGHSESPLELDTSQGTRVILMVGINGAGKTTTCGKLAHLYQQQGKTVLLAAGDTYRAAAVEQLRVWGERNNVPVIAQHQGADSASVIFDALQAAISRKTDVMIADTAGRLQSKVNLMEELRKVKKVLGKLDETAPHEVMLVLDAGTGQNALQQARQFQEVVDVTGIALTKLDGTAKGGILFAIADQLQIPVRYIGVGEKIDDLQPFSSEEFVNALFEE